MTTGNVTGNGGNQYSYEFKQAQGEIKITGPGGREFVVGGSSVQGLDQTRVQEFVQNKVIGLIEQYKIGTKLTALTVKGETIEKEYTREAAESMRSRNKPVKKESSVQALREGIQSKEATVKTILEQAGVDTNQENWLQNAKGLLEVGEGVNLSPGGPTLESLKHDINVLLSKYKKISLLSEADHTQKTAAQTFANSPSTPIHPIPSSIEDKDEDEGELLRHGLQPYVSLLTSLSPTELDALHLKLGNLAIRETDSNGPENALFQLVDGYKKEFNEVMNRAKLNNNSFSQLETHIKEIRNPPKPEANLPSVNQPATTTTQKTSSVPSTPAPQPSTQANTTLVLNQLTSEELVAMGLNSTKGKPTPEEVKRRLEQLEKIPSELINQLADKAFYNNISNKNVSNVFSDFDPSDQLNELAKLSDKDWNEFQTMLEDVKPPPEPIRRRGRSPERKVEKKE